MLVLKVCAHGCVKAGKSRDDTKLFSLPELASDVQDRGVREQKRGKEPVTYN